MDHGDHGHGGHDMPMPKCSVRPSPYPFLTNVR